VFLALVARARRGVRARALGDCEEMRQSFLI
jgi:hypothetical protein